MRPPSIAFGDGIRPPHRPGVPLRGGSTGFWPESTGAPGVITAMVTGAGLGITTSELVAE